RGNRLSDADGAGDGVTAGTTDCATRESKLTAVVVGFGAARTVDTSGADCTTRDKVTRARGAEAGAVVVVGGTIPPPPNVGAPIASRSASRITRKMARLRTYRI